MQYTCTSILTLEVGFEEISYFRFPLIFYFVLPVGRLNWFELLQCGGWRYWACWLPFFGFLMTFLHKFEPHFVLTAIYSISGQLSPFGGASLQPHFLRKLGLIPSALYCKLQVYSCTFSFLFRHFWCTWLHGAQHCHHAIFSIKLFFAFRSLLILANNVAWTFSNTSSLSSAGRKYCYFFQI